MLALAELGLSRPSGLGLPLAFGRCDAAGRCWPRPAPLVSHEANDAERATGLCRSGGAAAALTRARALCAAKSPKASSAAAARSSGKLERDLVACTGTGLPPPPPPPLNSAFFAGECGRRCCCALGTVPACRAPKAATPPIGAGMGGLRARCASGGRGSDARRGDGSVGYSPNTISASASPSASPSARQSVAAGADAASAMSGGEPRPELVDGSVLGKDHAEASARTSELADGAGRWNGPAGSKGGQGWRQAAGLSGECCCFLDGDGDGFMSASVCARSNA